MAKAIDDRRLQLGEGAGYDPETGTAWWFDIVGKRLYEHRPDTGTTVEHALPFMASEIARVDASRQLLAAENGLYLRHVKDGVLEPYLPLEAENEVTRSNDGRVHPSGAMWISTMGRNEEDGAGTIYHLRRGKLRPLFPRITISNCISFTEDGRTAYFVDTKKNVLHRVATDPGTGLPEGEPEDVFEHTGEGGLDGAVVDREGNIWIAIYGGGRVEAHAPDGRLLHTIPVPARQVTCPTFVGRRADRLIVTTAAQGLDEAALAKDPQAGRTFLLDVEVRGFFSPPVEIC